MGSASWVFCYAYGQHANYMPYGLYNLIYMDGYAWTICYGYI